MKTIETNQITHHAEPSKVGSIMNNQSSIINTPNLPSLRLVFLSLIPCALPLFVPQCLSGHESIMQNKPNSQKPKTNATSFTTKDYTNIPPRSAAKNKPKSNPFYRGEARPRGSEALCEAGTNSTRRGEACSKAGSSVEHPVSSILAVRNTQYEIRHPKYEIRFTPAPWGRYDRRPPAFATQTERPFP